jgi:hypothetical protein
MQIDFTYSTFASWASGRPKLRGSGLLGVTTARLYTSQLRQLFKQKKDAVIAPFDSPYVWPTQQELDAWLDDPSRWTRQRAFAMLCEWASTFDAVDVNGEPIGTLLPPEFNTWVVRARNSYARYVAARAVRAIAEQKPLFFTNRYAWCGALAQPDFDFDRANGAITMVFRVEWRGRTYSGVRHFIGLDAAAVYLWNQEPKMRFYFHDNLEPGPGTRITRRLLSDADLMYGLGVEAFSPDFDRVLQDVLDTAKRQAE